MNKTVSRVLWIVAGVLLIVAGGACMLHPGATLSGLSFLLGMAMLFSGVVDIIIFATAGQQYLRFRMVFGGWHPYGAAVHLPAVQPDVHHDDSALYSGYVAVVLRHHEICKLL